MNASTRWMLPTATVALAIFGCAAIVAATLIPAGAGDLPLSTPSSTPRPTVTAGPAGTSAPAGSRLIAVDELADPDWIERVAAAGDIPPRALTAYGGASLAVARMHPDCGLGWNTLAAIGLVESEHGTLGGSRLDDDGIAHPDIIGIPLDGDGVNEVRDSDGGVLDGDATWDRAVGPMQFIPTSWEVLAQDGDLDGREDVHDIDDATLAAAIHLCAVGGDLTEPANWIAAISAYNPSVDYNNRVAEAANHYANLR